MNIPLLVTGIGTTFACIGWCANRIIEYRRESEFSSSAERDGWWYIGMVDFICVYPIEGGSSITLESAYFGEFGLEIPDLTTLERTDVSFADRGYVLISTPEDTPTTAVLMNRNLCREPSDNAVHLSLWNTLKSASGNVQNSRYVQYLNKRVNMSIPTSLLRGTIQRAFNFSDNTIQIASFAPISRKFFNEATKRELRDQNNPELYCANYATFTMVNSESVKYLKKKCGRKDLSYKNFRPHIVFKGKRAFIEDDINELKIGNVEFTNVTPCVHREDINFAFDKPKTSIFNCCFSAESNHEKELRCREPYAYLRRKRPLRDWDIDFPNADNPVFGINFGFRGPESPEGETEAECLARKDSDRPNRPERKFAKGQPVYVRYRPASSTVDEHVL